VAEKVEELLSRQRMQRLRESWAFRSLGLCSSCVLEVPEGVLGVLGGRHGSSLVTTEEKRGKGGKVFLCWTMEEEGFGGVVDGWSGCGCEVRDGYGGSEPGPLLLKTFLWHSCCGVEE
jgi:hypothetical protein